MTSRTQRRNADMGSALFSAARNNPEGLLLLAAGAALLLRSALPARSPRGQRRGQQHGSQEDSRMASRWVDTGQVAESMEDARDYMADLGGRMSDTASSYAASAQRYASDMGQTMAARTEQFYEDTTSTLGETAQRVLRDQPLVVALAGLAAGAALATAFPRTEFEEQTLGPAGERVMEFATEKAEEFKDAGREAGQRLKSAAEQRGLTPEGMKEMAQEAAQAFTGALGGNDKSAGEPTGESSGKGRSGAAGT